MKCVLVTQWKKNCSINKWIFNLAHQYHHCHSQCNLDWRRFSPILSSIFVCPKNKCFSFVRFYRERCEKKNMVVHRAFYRFDNLIDLIPVQSSTFQFSEILKIQLYQRSLFIIPIRQKRKKNRRYWECTIMFDWMFSNGQISMTSGEEKKLRGYNRLWMDYWEFLIIFQ